MIHFIALFLLFFGCLLLPTLSSAQLNSYQFEQIDSLQKNKKKAVLVFIHTDWCKYCQAMKNITLKNKKIIEQLNENFYFINFNAEEKRAIYFNNQIFTLKPTGYNTGVHKLAEALATVNGAITYPTVCFLSASNEIIYQVTDYKNEHQFLLILQLLK